MTINCVVQSFAHSSLEGAEVDSLHIDGHDVMCSEDEAGYKELEVFDRCTKAKTRQNEPHQAQSQLQAYSESDFKRGQKSAHERCQRASQALKANIQRRKMMQNQHSSFLTKPLMVSLLKSNKD